jgi:protein kinase-like protein
VRRWADYELLEEIGRGAFGTVYRSFHPTLRQHVAIKLVAVPSGQPRDIEKALDEPRRLASVRHEHVVTVHDARYADGYVGICMEFVRGATLAHYVSRGVRLGADETIALGSSLCRALSAIHRAHLVHSDVKAHNVMREEGGRIVLMDFGAGRRLIDPDRTTGHYVVGTPAYMAPELFATAEAGPGTDIYSLGVLLFYVLCGAYPVEGASLPEYAAAHARHARRYLGDQRDDIPARLVRVIERALEPNPHKRYQTAGEMLLDLSDRAFAASGERDVAADPVAPPLPYRQDGWIAADNRGAAALTWVRERLPAAAALAALVVLFVWMLGYVESKAYAVMFGLSGDFGAESPFVWLDVGIRTLPLPLFYLVSIVVICVMGTFAWRMLTRMSRTVGTWSEETSRRIERVTLRTGLHDPAALAGAVVIVQLIAVLVVYAWFHGIFGALTAAALRDAPLDAHVRLGHRNEAEWLAYRGVTSVLAAVSGAVWIAILRRRRTGDPGGASVAGGLALTLVFVAMFAVPWRIVQQAVFQTAEYGTTSGCFVLAERSARVLLFCPGPAGSRSVIVSDTDPKLKRLAQYENIFDTMGQSGRSERTR